ncbi:MAG: hypothetical protein ABIH23_20685 [bacterium]
MESHGKIVEVSESEDTELRGKIEDHAPSKKKKEQMLKDVHLIEAAMATDRSVVSLDETARDLFVKASTNVDQLADVVWVNPSISAENAISWLQQGAKAEKKRMLGFQTGNPS